MKIWGRGELVLKINGGERKKKRKDKFQNQLVIKGFILKF